MNTVGELPMNFNSWMDIGVNGSQPSAVCEVMNALTLLHAWTPKLKKVARITKEIQPAWVVGRFWDSDRCPLPPPAPTVPVFNSNPRCRVECVVGHRIHETEASVFSTNFGWSSFCGWWQLPTAFIIGKGAVLKFFQNSTFVVVIMSHVFSSFLTHHGSQ